MGVVCSPCSDSTDNLSRKMFGSFNLFIEEDRWDLPQVYDIESKGVEYRQKYYIPKNSSISLNSLSTFDDKWSGKINSITITRLSNTPSNQNLSGCNYNSVFPSKGRLARHSTDFSSSDVKYQMEKLDSDWHDFIFSKRQKLVSSTAATVSSEQIKGTYL